MMAITRDEIVSVLGPVDDELVAELMATGASAEELREVWGWLHSHEALMGAGRPLPGTRVGRLIEILEPDEDEGSRAVRVSGVLNSGRELTMSFLGRSAPFPFRKADQNRWRK